MLRDATDADVPAITALANAFIGTRAIEWTDTPHTEDGRRRWVHDRQDAGFPVVVAEVAGEVVGYASYGWFRDAVARPGYRFTVEHSVHVREDHWGTGIGRQLITELVDRATAAGLHSMIAAVDGENDESIRFHERLGFEVVARMPEVGWKFDRWLDLILLQKRL